MSARVPSPSAMPIDRAQCARQLNLSNFVNAHAQFGDLQRRGADICKVIVINPGQGLDADILKWWGYEVLRFDIDETFNRDAIGSAQDPSAFSTTTSFCKRDPIQGAGKTVDRKTDRAHGDTAWGPVVRVRLDRRLPQSRPEGLNAIGLARPIAIAACAPLLMLEVWNSQ